MKSDESGRKSQVMLADDQVKISVFCSTYLIGHLSGNE